MRLFLVLATFLTCLTGAHAQWTTESYNFEPGWNAIYALNDASHVDLDTLLAAETRITQVWRWEPTNLTSQFIGDPTQTVSGQEWKTWQRGDPVNSTLQRLLPNFGYLVLVTGSDPLTLAVKGRAVLNRVDWRASGANLVGFPASTSPRPRFGGTTSGYFAPLSGVGYRPLTTNIYQYIGGPISGTNPARVTNPAAGQMVRGKAYWVELAAYTDFVSPVKLELSSGDGMEFGTRGGPQKIMATNRSAATLTVTLTPSASESAPVGETPVADQVPLLERVWNATLQDFEYRPVTGALRTSLAAGETATWTLVPDRASMGGASGTLYASVLQVTDSGPHGSYSEIAVPVTAETGDLGGLWVGDAVITGVQNQLQRFDREADGSNVINEDGSYVLLESNETIADSAQAFRLRLIVHVDETGTARLLSNVYFGALDTAPPVVGFATEQRFLQPAGLDKAARITANHLPLDLVETLSGGFGLGVQSSATVTLAHDDPTNPFVHTYHPDHDNMDARFSFPLVAGAESQTVSRAITLTVDAASPDGDPAWGTSILTGSYAETLTGLHKKSIAVEGVFGLRRLSDETTLQQ